VSIPQTTGKGDSRKKLLTPSSQNTPQRASPAGPGQNFNLTVDGSSSGTSPRTRIGRRKKKAGAPTPPSQIFLEAVVTPERQKVRCGWRCCPWTLMGLMWAEAHPNKDASSPRRRDAAGLSSRQQHRMYNTMQVPRRLESLLGQGTLLCVDSYLFLFTFFPLRLVAALCHALPRLLPLARNRFRRLRSDESVDIVRGLLVLIPLVALLSLDISKAYHFIRGQATPLPPPGFGFPETCLGPKKSFPHTELSM
jgi:hypothetical protein